MDFPDPAGMERVMPTYAPELCAIVIDRYLHTDDPVGVIAHDLGINERDITQGGFLTPP